MSVRRYGCDPLVICRAALAAGPLVPASAGRFGRVRVPYGRRVFSQVTINALIAAGEAERLADGRVVACVPQT